MTLQCPVTEICLEAFTSDTWHVVIRDRSYLPHLSPEVWHQAPNVLLTPSFSEWCFVPAVFIYFYLRFYAAVLIDLIGFPSICELPSE